MTEQAPSDPDEDHDTSPGPMAAIDGPYPRLLDYQLLTPAAPLAPGAALRVYPLPIGPGPARRVPAQWAPDPSARHQWRWWSGASWTDYVADDGETSKDPLRPT